MAMKQEGKFRKNDEEQQKSKGKGRGRGRGRQKVELEADFTVEALAVEDAEAENQTDVITEDSNQVVAEPVIISTETTIARTHDANTVGLVISAMPTLPALLGLARAKAAYRHYRRVEVVSPTLSPNLSWLEGARQAASAASLLGVGMGDQIGKSGYQVYDPAGVLSAQRGAAIPNGLEALRHQLKRPYYDKGSLLWIMERVYYLDLSQAAEFANIGKRVIELLSWEPKWGNADEILADPPYSTVRDLVLRNCRGDEAEDFEARVIPFTISHLALKMAVAGKAQNPETPRFTPTSIVHFCYQFVEWEQQLEALGDKARELANHQRENKEIPRFRHLSIEDGNCPPMFYCEPTDYFHYMALRAVMLNRRSGYAIGVFRLPGQHFIINTNKGKGADLKMLLAALRQTEPGGGWNGIMNKPRAEEGEPVMVSINHGSFLELEAAGSLFTSTALTGLVQVFANQIFTAEGTA